MLRGIAGKRSWRRPSAEPLTPGSHAITARSPALASPLRKPAGAYLQSRTMLTERQELVLRRLVEEYLDEGAPCGSKALSAGFTWGPSTIRHELANLEELGLLAHPHTSAGRIPPEAGYRYFVDRLLDDPLAAPALLPTPGLGLSLVRHEIDEA